MKVFWAAACAAVLALAAASPWGPAHASTTASDAFAAAFQRGLERAWACEPEVDADLSHYVRCIDSALAHRPGSAATTPGVGLTADARRRAVHDADLGLLFQAWRMADLAVQQDSEGARAARKRWALALQRSLGRSGPSLEQVARLRGLDPSMLQERLRISQREG